jgi:hypothetical protein
VSVDLNKELAKASRKYRPGSVVKLVIVGKIDSISYRKPDDPDESGYEGHMSVEVQKREMLESARNEMAELLDDDE